MYKYLIFASILIFNISCEAYAQPEVIKVTPAKTISTARKNQLNEGDFVNFKIIEDSKTLKRDEIVTGVVTSIENNGFAGKEAQVVIENFRYKDKMLDGDIYLHGNVHKKLNDFVDGSMNSFPILLRGGEVIARPNEQVFLLYIKE